MKKILASIFVLGLTAATAIGASRAFFTDTEISHDNILAAGDLDLKIDSEAHYLDMVCTVQPTGGPIWTTQSTTPMRPDLVGAPCDGTWPSKDLVAEKFFNLSDIKPGDEGENTISLNAASNDLYACAAIYNLTDLENTFLDAELEDGDPGVPDGELAENVNFFAWSDDGDNDWEAEELPLFTNTSGPASDVLNGVVYPLFTPATSQILEGQTKFIGLYWCYGTIDATTAGTLLCDGSPVDNQSMTDSVSADMAFYAEQARNNDGFTCPDITTFQTPA